jgi:2-polyprenyl-6-methoxyphenol hydroxylase-like FAD-dependent oxidoreductase
MASGTRSKTAGRMRIVCIGAGPAGLYFAILMKARDRGHEVTVLERNPAGVTYGWGVVFWDDLVEQLRASDPTTAREIGAAAFRWNGERLAVEGRGTAETEGHGYGIGRQRLLELLLERARSLGVRVEFGREVESLAGVADADLVVACDGVSSRIRQRSPESFRTEVRVGRNKYIWLGTSKVFDVFTFGFVETSNGWIWCHAYGFDDSTSTFIVECSPETWAGLGFDRLAESDAFALLERLFESQLDGHPLKSKVRADGAAHWLNFRTLTNEQWHHDNVALMGDAAHTTHFTIGSGTKLALEDAIALASRLGEGTELQAALAAYGAERRTALRPAQTSARFSAQWFENVSRYAGLDPDRFFALLHERRSPLLPRIPPPLYYRLHRATHEVPALRSLRKRVAPRIKSLYR